jgi:hypothetical protein
VASVTTTDVFTSVALMQASAVSTNGTIGYVIVGGKATPYVFLTAAGGAPANGWYKVGQA